MTELVIQTGWFFSQADERHFFEWLGSIKCVRSYEGRGAGEVVVSLRSAKLSKPDLLELLALHMRYDLPMKSLVQFRTKKNEAWFCDSGKYWYKRVFDK
jgi:hypothetical protein